MTRAKDKLSHWGYQSWHRDLDKKILAWLEEHTDVTLIDFHAYLRSLYSEGELLKRFPNGLPGL